MTGWNFNWQAIKEVLGAYESSLYWLAIVMVAIFILGTQLVFFPLCYRVMKMQATTAMRRVASHKLHVLGKADAYSQGDKNFDPKLKNYWVWLFWCLFSLGWIALVVWTPKRRLEA